jgi:hypothetical protein
MTTIPDTAIDQAEKNLRDILTLSIEHTRSAIVVWDGRSTSSRARYI